MFLIFKNYSPKINMDKIDKSHILDKRFDYDYAINHRLEIPKMTFSIKNKKILIELLVTNGFVKLYTYKGRIYHIRQNEDNHTLPDWKFHFNVQASDIGKAFNIVNETLLEHIIKTTDEKDIKEDIVISTKAYNINLVTEMQAGREVTLYIYTYDKRLNNNEEEIDIDDENGNTKKVKYIYRKEEEKSFKFYYDLLIDIENKLSKNKIKKTIENGAANGDLWIGKYSSLRNEAYYKSKRGGYIYPPNDKGWNSLKQKKPFSWVQIFKMRYALVYKYKKIQMWFWALVLLIISVILYLLYNLL